MEPSASDEAVPSKLTVSGATPDTGVAVTTADGAPVSSDGPNPPGYLMECSETVRDARPFSSHVSCTSMRLTCPGVTPISPADQVTQRRTVYGVRTALTG